MKETTMKTNPLIHAAAFGVILALSACAGTPRQPQPNDCEQLHKGSDAAINACLQERRSHFWSFL